MLTLFICFPRSRKSDLNYLSTLRIVTAIMLLLLFQYISITGFINISVTEMPVNHFAQNVFSTNLHQGLFQDLVLPAPLFNNGFNLHRDTIVYKILSYLDSNDAYALYCKLSSVAVRNYERLMNRISSMQ